LAVESAFTLAHTPVLTEKIQTLRGKM